MVAVVAVMIGVPAQAQSEPRRFVHAVYAELLGNAGLISVNAEHQFPRGAIFRLAIGSWTSEDWFSDNETRVTSMPLTLAFTRGEGKHQLEWGGGLTAGHRSETFGSDGPFVSLTGIAGYRYHRPDGGFLFRATFTPFLGLSGGENAYPDEGFTPSIGLSFGYGSPRR